MALKVGELYGVLKLDRSNFDRGMSGAKQNFAKFKKAMLIGAVLIAAALFKIGKSAISASIDFQKSMANVHTLLGGTAEDQEKRVTELGASVKEMSRETGKSLEDLTGGLYQIISAFGDSESSMAKLSIASKASVAGLSSTKDAVNLLSAVTKGYNRTSEKATQKASDLAFQTVVLGQTSFPELARAMGKVIPSAAALGISQKELFAGFATLTGVTGNTDEVSTQLMGTYQKLLKPSTELKKAFKELHVQDGKALIKKYGLIKALDKINGTRVVEKEGLAQVIGSSRAYAAVQSLVSTAADDYRKKLKLLNKAQGSTDDAYEKQAKTAQHALNRVKASWDVLLVNLGDKFLPKLEEFLDFLIINMPTIEKVLEGVFNAIGSAFNWLIENVLPLAVSGIGMIVGVLDGIVSGLESLTGIDKGQLIALGAAIAGILMLFMMHPVIAILAGIVLGLGLLAKAWDEDWGGIRTEIEEAWSKIQPVLSDIFDWFADFMASEDVANFLDFFLAPFRSIAIIIGGLIDTIVLILEGDFGGAFDKVMETAGLLKDNIVGSIRSLIEGLIGIAPDMLLAASKIGRAVWDGIVGFLAGIPNALSQIIEDAINAIATAWDALEISIPEFHFQIIPPGEAMQGTPLAFDWAGVSIDFGGSGDLVPNAITGLARGDWNVAGPMPALLHAGEMVIPAAIARQMREGSGAFGDLLSNPTSGQGPLIGQQNIYGIQPNEVERQTRRAIRRQQHEATMSGRRR